MLVLIPRVSDMHDGTFRPEVVYDDADAGGIHMFAPLPDANAAWEYACDVCELVPGDWTDSGRWYVVPAG
jgi:hypothetical protein